MKLKFKNQDFQTEAVNAVVDIFRGQEKKQSTFTILQDSQVNLFENALGYGNVLNAPADELIANMQDIQKRLKLPTTDSLEGRQYSLELETGTGKTYVYTKTIFELNRQYGFTKFIIVVPSVAIREGVYKSFQITEEHFKQNYDNVPYRYFIYNSAKLSNVRDFAANTNIQIMIINIDAFKKSENIINQEHDKLNGEKAISFISECNPIVIIDEPQSVDNTDKAKEAIASLNPLCVLRYSATHKEKVNLMYRLTPVDAYQMGLVKQICVSSNEVIDDFNKPYIKLISVNNESGFRAKIEIDILTKGSVKRIVKTIKPNDDLFVISGERELYENYIIAGIDCTAGRESIEFTNQDKIVLGKAIGDIPDEMLKRAQIRRTIETHLDKELRLLDKGIKVLSLFFIDEVKKYRDYENEEDTRGLYARIFEECYDELLSKPKYETLKSKFPFATSSVHNGYFSQDKKGNYKNTKGDTIDDYSTYNTIMKEKEWLLSFECPLRFIFSHSALKEGWDNPNVFQVCTLIEQKSTFTCRQKIGRGLRLCVDQTGERIEDRNINILHVIANESFAEFADTLQKEIEQETGVKFGAMDIGIFADMTYVDKVIEEKKITKDDAKEIVTYLENKGYIDEKGVVKSAVKQELSPGALELPQKFEAARENIEKMICNTTESKIISTNSLTNQTYKIEVNVEKTMTYDESKELITHFENKGYISKGGKIKDTMKTALLNGTLDLPQKYENARERFENIIRQSDNRLPLRNAANEVTVKLKNAVILSPEFEALWDKIKHKTTYQVNINTEKLVETAIELIKALPPIPKAKIVTRTSKYDIKKSGITFEETSAKAVELEDTVNKLPDIVRIIKDDCLLTRKTILKILLESGRIADFSNNPQKYIEQVKEAVITAKNGLIVDGIRYKRLNGEEHFVQEIFESEELIAYLEKNAVEVKNSVYDHVIYDSETVEKPFALALDNDEDVKLFAKLPSAFKINTPLGTYNPDWAVYMDIDGTEKLYFVVETKGSVNTLDLRGKELMKIHCGEEHFKALDNEVDFRTANNWNSVKLAK